MKKHYGFIESLQAFQEGHEYKFCMPAHSGRYISPEFKSLLDKFGMKNIEGSSRALKKAYDFKDGVLGDLGELYRKAFNSQITLLLQSGSSQGNHVISYCLAGKKVLIQSNSHISMHAGLQLSGSRVFYVQPEYDAEFDFLLPIRPQQVQEILGQHPEIEAVYLTNPTYEGLCFDVEAMKEACGPDRLFIVDEAHGSHFYFSNQCPKAALQGGADAAITSIHKTLGGISGTSLINVGKTSRLDREKIRMQHFMMAGGCGDCISPFILADIEGCVHTFIDDGQKLVSQAIGFADQIRNIIEELSTIKLGKFEEAYPHLQKDPIKITFKIAGLKGSEIWDLLETQYKINVEKYTKKAVTITVHPHINQEDVDALINALRDIHNQQSQIQTTATDHHLMEEQEVSNMHQPLYKHILNDRDLVMDIRDCFASDSEVIPFKEALGRISCEIKYACPPGFPILLYGERIQANHLKLFAKDDASMVKVVCQAIVQAPDY